MPIPCLRTACLRALLILASLIPALAAPKIYTTGTPATAPPALSGPGWNLGGGGTDVDAAMQWLVNHVRGGATSSTKVDIVVLRCTGTNGYNAPWSTLTGVSSVSTIIGTSRADFDFPKAATLVRNAGVVFYAGGNQGDYVNFIKGSACDTEAKGVVARGGGMGGTSAGCAIQGPLIFDSLTANAAGGANVASADALADPYESTISFTRDWYAWPCFTNTLCEPHFGDPAANPSNKDRMGRLMAFLARQVKDRNLPVAWGLAVNAGTSVVVDRNGLATVMGTGAAGDGVAYLVLLDHTPEVCVPATPLTCSGYKIWRFTAGQTFDLAHRPTCSYYVGGVNGGTLTGNFYPQGPLVTGCDTAPAILTQPLDQTVTAGQPATFSVVASGSNLAYQWFRGGTSLAGATASSYTTPATTGADTGAGFSVTVTNTLGGVTSRTATLTVTSGGSTFTEAESNNSLSQANDLSSLAFPLTLSGTASSSSDIDYFKLTLAPGQTLVATLTVPSTADLDLKLKRASGSQLASSTNNGKGVGESFSYKNTGTTTLTVYPEVLGYTGSGAYTLRLTKQ